jgi:eukaryotic-like serine/threonine-protein kinase
VSKVPDPTLDPTLESPLFAQRVANERSSRLQVGQVVGDRYRIEAPIGQGGMGVVYAAVHQHTGRAVALKLIQCAWDDERLELYQRFLAEARAASAIRHPNVVDVLDMGFLAGAPYLVMERLSGESLEELLTRLEVLPLASTIGWLLPVMGALQALHDKGIVHRDLKPSNIFLSYDEGKRIVPKLLDFGLARVTHDAPITHPGVMLGTPEYMAPERARGQAVGPAADIWAMGVVAFECLCGKLPFTATNLNGIAAQIVAGEVLRARAVNPGLPIAIAAVIDRALMNAPEQRHQNMGQFAHALGAAALSAGLSVPADPDPIGLPEFATLHLQGDPWASGPLAKAFAAADGARSASPARQAPARTRPLRAALLFAGLSLLGLIASLYIRSAALPGRTSVASEGMALPGAPALPDRVPPPKLQPEIVEQLPHTPAPIPEPARDESAKGLAPAPSPPELGVAADPSATPPRPRRVVRARAKNSGEAAPLGVSEFEKEWN